MLAAEDVGCSVAQKEIGEGERTSQHSDNLVEVPGVKKDPPGRMTQHFSPRSEAISRWIQ